MDLRKELSAKQSKERVIKVLNYIGTNENRLSELMDIFLNGEARLCQHSAWVVGHFGEKHPELIEPYIGKFIKKLKTKGHNAIRRNVVRTLAFTNIKEKYLGEIAELCFTYVADPKEAIAVRCFSITVLHNICKKEPMLANELKLVLEEQLPHASAGFKSRAKKTLKSLDGLIQ